RWREVDAAQPVVIGSQSQHADGRVRLQEDDGHGLASSVAGRALTRGVAARTRVVGSAVPARSIASFHRWITAYARHGRQASARAPDALAVSRELSVGSTFCSTRSSAGNASGWPSARIAMYCAVHGPM